MPGEDICREVSIVGGTYRETCYWPEWNELYGRMSDKQFITFFEESNVSLSKSGLLVFFKINFFNLYGKTKRSMILLDKFDRVIAYRITNEYQKFYNKWRELITANSRRG